MHKLESFALSSGAKISKSIIQKTFYPITEKKFICVSQSSDYQCYDYDFFDDVLFHIKPYLEQNNISVIEIGPSNRKPLFYSKGYKNLNRLQSNYVIDKSLLYLGNFNFYAHIASYYDKPAIVPCSNDFIELKKPYRADESFKAILPDIEEKPNFSHEEYPKTINLVQPEIIAAQVLDSLKIKHKLHNVSTVYTGEEYFNQIIDVIPGDYDITQLQLKGSANIRLDKNFDLNFLAQCKTIESVNLVTDKVIPEAHLKYLGDNLKMITFFVNNKTTKQDIKMLQSTGKTLNLLSKDFKNIKDIRFNLIDYQIRLFGTKTKKDLNCKSLKNLTFLSKRNIIYEGQIFNSYLSVSKKQNTSSVVDSSDFWEDLPFCRVFKTSKKK
jgi:hypothetical protein